LAVALHEWRTVFLSAGLFAILLVDALVNARRPAADVRLLASAWLAGAAAVSLVALWQFASGSMLITAEGVRRVRAFYGSPNNLALYLERTVAVTAALALFTRAKTENHREPQVERDKERGGGKRGWMSGRVFWAVLLLIQLGALLLTFSKGSILLGLPAALATLWLGGYWLLGQWGESRRALWWLAGLAALAFLALTPFLGTERFRGLLDFSQGTGFMRLQLWRSSWRMALDHPLLGVGPDNFLYAYRNWYILPTAWREPNLNHPHNWLLDWWTRLGVMGLLLGASFFAAGIAGLWRSFTRLSRPVLALGLLAATAAGLVHGLIDVSYALPDLMIVWVLIFYLGVMHEDMET
jgi:O-antigen ligase